jgi:hypothetical protein
MINTLINALNKTIENDGGREGMTGSVIQHYNEPIWYVTFLTSCGGTILLEVVWRDGGIVGSLLDRHKLSDKRVAKTLDFFLENVDWVADHPPAYDYIDPDFSDMPPLEN